MTSHLPVIVPVGGFLGAGKTTLLLTAARILKSRDLRVALLLNDQGFELVDAQWSSIHGYRAEGVLGGCFCCRFADFLDAAERLRESDVILAEPTGSCTDLVATVIRPLQDAWADRFRVAPLTVLVNPMTATRLRSNPDTRFLFDNQVAEADVLCFTHSDACHDWPHLPGVSVRRLSGRTGEGVGPWLDEVLFGSERAGARALDIDYARYAAAEAALAWLNCSVEIHANPAVSPALIVGPLFDAIDSGLTRAGVSIVHLKVFDQCETGVLKAAITTNGSEPHVEGDLSASPAARHHLLVNLRALGDPDTIAGIVGGAVPTGASVKRIEAFRPAPPIKPVAAPRRECDSSASTVHSPSDRR